LIFVFSNFSKAKSIKREFYIYNHLKSITLLKLLYIESTEDCPIF
jgi:hypothetical protein